MDNAISTQIRTSVSSEMNYVMNMNATNKLFTGKNK